MNKKYIILFIGSVVLLIIFIAIIVFQQSQSVPALPSQNPSALRQTNQNNSNVSKKLPPLAKVPKEAAKQFYYYYYSPQNPLAAGAYKNNPYLSDDFKTVISAWYNNGNAPVFCPQNKRTNISVGNERTYYYNNQYLTQEVISEAPPGSQELYQITLENKDGKWFIFDVNCI